MSIVEIETEIKKLPPEKVDELVDWLGNYRAEIWDKKIADDLDSGRLDSLLAEIDVEIDAGLAAASTAHTSSPTFRSKTTCSSAR